MEEFKGDKRTKEYKEWKENHAKRSKGVGDSIKKGLELLGVDKAIKFIAGDDCGCDDRADGLNRAFPYQDVKCFTESEFWFVKELEERNPSILTRKEVLEIYRIKNRVFSTNDDPSNCSGCVEDRLRKLKAILKTYS